MYIVRLSFCAVDKNKIMKQVWKCDFCTETNTDKAKIAGHEPKCSFNPINKKCFTCKHSAWEWDLRVCRKDLDTINGEDEGNCSGWANEA